MGRCSSAAVTSPPNNLNHHLNYSHNNDTRALHYEHYCWEMGPTEVKDESYLSLSVGTLVMVTGPSDLCWGFSLSSTRQIYHQITGWCQCPLHKMGWPSIAAWLRSLWFTSDAAPVCAREPTDGVKKNNKKNANIENATSRASNDSKSPLQYFSVNVYIWSKWTFTDRRSFRLTQTRRKKRECFSLSLLLFPLPRSQTQFMSNKV